MNLVLVPTLPPDHAGIGVYFVIISVLLVFIFLYRNRRDPTKRYVKK
jgi:hypothetical protein